MSSVVVYESASLNDRMKYAQTLAAAGDLIPKGLRNPDGTPSPGKILLVMETGSMLGLHPAAALQSIDVVEGRATLSAKLMSALIRKAGHRLEIRKTGTIPGGDYSVTVVGTRADTSEVFTDTWDIDRGIRAGSVDSYTPNAAGVWKVRARTRNDVPKPWEAYAESMPVNRAISVVAREGFSDILFGLYGTEEMTDGGIPIAEPDPEPTEDWLALISAADTRADLDELAERLKQKQEGTDKIRTAWLARAGFLDREANTVDAEIVVDPETPGGGEAAAGDHPGATGAHPSTAPGEQTPAGDLHPTATPSAGPPAGTPDEMTAEEFEAAEAARFDAEAGEVTGA